MTFLGNIVYLRPGKNKQYSQSTKLSLKLSMLLYTKVSVRVGITVRVLSVGGHWPFPT